MGYSTKQEVILALANALSQGNPVGGVGTVSPITSIGKTITDTVTDQDIQQYIRWADQNIDAALSSIYRTPLRRVNMGTFQLALDITTGDDQATLVDATRFLEGDIVLVRDDVNSQQMTILAIPNDNVLEFTTPFTTGYLANDSKVERIRYPDPVPKISARTAAAYLYDKYFAAQVTGNQSDYGKNLRALAFEDINAILSGAIRLELADAGDYVGRRYQDAALDDTPSTRAKPGEVWFKGGI